ncbi:MAG: SpoIID/LytB domain-containing protein [Acidobacteria bacterium]|nr:SpoIID/LytB domain-containing protein [Acidobacteriota bacterium]
MVRIGALSNGGAVTTLPLEVYVARVLAGEGEPRAADAASQALAIAIRTFALANPGRHARDGFDLCDTTHCQVPRAATPATRRAVLATAGQVLAYNGVPAEVFYSASCGGRSESASAVWPGANYPYLRSVRDDVHEDDEEWTVELPLREIRRALERAGFEGSRLRDVRIDARTASGRAARLRLAGLQPDVIAGEQFRAAIGASALRSTAFSIQKRGETVRFTGRGYGHGVGMCVIGAGRRASRGAGVRAILAQYYPGLDLVGADRVRLSPPERPPAVLPPSDARLSRSPIVARVPHGSAIAAGELERLAMRAHDELSKALGTSPAPVTTIELHDSLESFRLATGMPWWVGASAGAATIDLAPAPLLAQREGLETAIRIAVAERLVSEPLAGRPLWVRVGAARYFGRQAPLETPSSSGRPRAPTGPAARCPADAELTLAISAAAQRDAEARAEACFARAYAASGDWRSVGR